MMRYRRAQTVTASDVCGCCPTRRDVLAGFAALSVSAAASSAQPQPDIADGRCIDVHHHVSSPAFISSLGERGVLPPPIGAWSVQKSLDDMDHAGVSNAILSVTTPGVWFGNAEAARMSARECNNYSARLVADHKGRFGMFALLPMPDIDGSLKEMEYALDVLKADGIGLFTSYGDKWLGDPAFNPLYEELNRRKVVVYTHPSVANCCRNLMPDVPQAEIELGTDTTRAIMRMLMSGTATRYRDFHIIFSHAGGTMPFLIERFINAITEHADKIAATPEEGRRIATERLAMLGSFYYDTAQASNAVAMAALKKVVPVSQIVFGTDFPFRTSEKHVRGLRASGVFSVAELRDINRENALRLLPNVKG